MGGTAFASPAGCFDTLVIVIVRARPVPGRIRLALSSDVEALTRIHVASWHATYRDLIAPHNLARIEPKRTLARFRRHFWHHDDSMLHVLELPSGVVGYACSGSAGDLDMRGEVYELYLDPAMQRRGHGRRLLTAAMWALAERGQLPAFVWVLSDNHPARRFYEAMRGQPIADAQARIGDQLLPKTAYAWVDYLPWPEAIAG